MTLALLITAVGGAWADEGTLLTTINASSDFKSGSKTFDNVATVTFSGSVNYGGGWFYTVSTPVTVTVSAANDDVTITSVKFFTTLGDVEDKESTYEAQLKAKNGFDPSIGAILYYQVYVNGSIIGAENAENYLTKIEVYGTKKESAIEVTTNAAEEGATFTEATFNMPAFDATAEYELVRDMSIQMTATMGDGTDGVRYRVKKAQQGEGYEPADLSMMQVLALVAVNDGIEQKALTLDQDYFCRIYKLDEQTLQPTGDGVKLNDFDFAPGLYALKAFAKDGSDYDGETALSNTFKLFQGYEVEVAAKEFITYYKDEPLYADTETSADAELYTITSVSADQATLSAAIQTAPSLTPLLIFNNSDQAKTFLLIPANEEPNLALTVAPEFIGTLEATTIAASSEGQTNYALNGKAFVFVKNAIEVGPNKAWLSIPSGANARVINLVFGDATAIEMVNGQSSMVNGTWYDLNGRKLNAIPTKKGVYIMNGKKVVVK